jgi:hypothetical protein
MMANLPPLVAGVFLFGWKCMVVFYYGGPQAFWVMLMAAMGAYAPLVHRFL